jgi:hypothetical protein
MKGRIPVEKMQRVSTMVPVLLHRRLKAWCATNGVSINDTLREMLDRKLDQQERQSATKTKAVRGEARV